MKNNAFVKLLSLSLSLCTLLSVNSVPVYAEMSEKAENQKAALYATESKSDFSDTIAYANNAANGIVARYIDDSRNGYTIKNQNMSLDYYLTMSKNSSVSALRSASGKNYVSGTMDAYVKMNDGGIYYSSRSET